MRNTHPFKHLALAGGLGLAVLLPLAPADALEAQEYQGIPYVSGGIGTEERDELNAMAGNFNLKLLFAASSGKYLSNNQIVIQDRRGNTVLEATSNGPWFYTRLPPGAYTVQVSGPGRTLRQGVQLSGGARRQLNFYWKDEAP